MRIDRRGLAALSVSMLAAPAIAAAAGDPAPVRRAMDAFAALPAKASGLIVARGAAPQWQAAHDADAKLFVGSAVKTFILAQTLRAVEVGHLSENAQYRIDDRVRSVSSPVFIHLSGTTPLRSVLEAMITHSDNTATDVALAACGPDKVRALIDQAGLPGTQIPDSTRRLFSYIAGAPKGVDIGWKGLEAMQHGKSFGTPRPPLNDTETMTSSAQDMVKWYQTALEGQYFTKPETLREFKRILSMANAIASVVPSGIAAYGKGGSIDWNDFYCFAFAGQMVVNTIKVTCSFTINWTGKPDSVQPMFQSYQKAIADVLSAAHAAVA